jgi:hypothetical protein
VHKRHVEIVFIIEWIKKYAGKLHQKIVYLGRLMFWDNKVKLRWVLAYRLDGRDKKYMQKFFGS